MEKNTLFESLVAWINTFNLNEPDKEECKNANDFKDGRIIAKCLNNIDPLYFNDEWMNKMKVEANANWCLKVVNLKKIFQSILDYYSEVLNLSLSGVEMPDWSLIGESTDTLETQVELSHLLQLVLGCAVKCEKNGDFIQKIMEMNDDNQMMIMNAIQDLMAKDPSSQSQNSNLLKQSGNVSYEEISLKLKKALSDFEELNKKKAEIESKCKSLDKQILTLHDEKLALMTEIETLRETMQTKDKQSLDKQVKLQQKLDYMQEECYRLENEKDKYRIQFETAQLEQNNLIEKNIELKAIAQDARQLKDEIDVLKHTSDKVEKLETTISQYKIKLEEMDDLKSQMRDLEEKNGEYLAQIVQMEKNTKLVSTLRSQTELYKKQIHELHEQSLNDQTKAKMLEYELKSVEELCNNLRQEKQKLQHDYDTFKETAKLNAHESDVYPMSACSSMGHSSSTDDRDSGLSSIQQNSMPEEAADLNDLFSGVELLAMPNETKEKIKRLFHENKILKSKHEDVLGERSILLQTQLDDEKHRVDELQAKLEEASHLRVKFEGCSNDLKKKCDDLEFKLDEANRTRAELEAQLDDAKKKCNEISQLKSNDDEVSELKTKLTSVQTQLNSEIKSLTDERASLEAKIKLLNLENEELTKKSIKDLEDITAKDKEIQELNELTKKYQAYLEKAKYVIQNINPGGSEPVDQLTKYKSEISEKDKKIYTLTKELEKIKSARELEERLIASSWYQLGADLNRQATDERINAMGSSFLAQQRHMPSSMSVSSLSSSKRNLMLHNSSSSNVNGRNSKNHMLMSPSAHSVTSNLKH